MIDRLQRPAALFVSHWRPLHRDERRFGLLTLSSEPMMQPAAMSSFYQGCRVCVTGGCGFIGSHLVDALVELGAQVTIIDDLSSGRLENLASGAGSVEFVHGSILDEVATARAVTGGREGADVVFHLAALTSVPRSVQEPLLYHEVNALGTLGVLEAARAAGVGRVVFASSSSVYGERATEAKSETMLPKPRSPYAAAKCAGEHFMHAWAHCFAMSTISLRYFNIFGERQRSDSPYAAVIPLFVDALMHGRSPVIFGDGTQTRDFTHVSNAVRANLLAGACDRPLRGEAVNVACGEGASVIDLLRQIMRILGVEVEPEFNPPRTGEVLHSRADIRRATTMIGYEPVTSFAQGLERAARWYRDAIG